MGKSIISIDPGNEQSAMVVWNGKEVLFKIKDDNTKILNEVIHFCDCKNVSHINTFCVEKVASYGMAVGQTTFDTCVWAGRFKQCFIDYTSPNCVAEEIFRKDIKLHHCGFTRAKDSNIIQALKDRFEPGLQPRQRPKALLKGLKADIWQAFALAVYYYDEFVE